LPRLSSAEVTPGQSLPRVCALPILTVPTEAPHDLHAPDFPLAITVALLTLFAPEAKAQNNRAAFPADFDRYVLYATYDRGASREEAFAIPETLAIAKSGQPLPPGTKPVLGIWSN
jgi:hypothetical protein